MDYMRSLLDGRDVEPIVILDKKLYPVVFVTKADYLQVMGQLCEDFADVGADGLVERLEDLMRRTTWDDDNITSAGSIIGLDDDVTFAACQVKYTDDLHGALAGIVKTAYRLATIWMSAEFGIEPDPNDDQKTDLMAHVVSSVFRELLRQLIAQLEPVLSADADMLYHLLEGNAG